MDYSRTVAVAQRLISKFGRSLTVQHPASTPLDSSKPWRGPGDVASAVTLSVNGVFVTYQGKNPATDATRRSLQTVLVAPTANADDLTPFTQIVDGGEVWFVDEIDIVNPGGTVLLWKLHVKK